MQKTMIARGVCREGSTGYHSAQRVCGRSTCCSVRSVPVAKHARAREREREVAQPLAHEHNQSTDLTVIVIPGRIATNGGAYTAITCRLKWQASSGGGRQLTHHTRTRRGKEEPEGRRIRPSARGRGEKSRALAGKTSADALGKRGVNASSDIRTPEESAEPRQSPDPQVCTLRRHSTHTDTHGCGIPLHGHPPALSAPGRSRVCTRSRSSPFHSRHIITSGPAARARIDSRIRCSRAKESDSPW